MPPTLILDPLEQNPFSAIIDQPNGYGYFGCYTAPGMIVKVYLGDGSAPPTKVATLTLTQALGESLFNSAIIGQPNGYVWLLNIGTRPYTSRQDDGQGGSR